MNKMIKTLAAVAIAAVTSTSFAAAVVNTNVRPVAIGSSGAEPSLQSALNALYGPGAINAVTGQSAAGMWSAASSIGTTIPTVAFEATAAATTQKFGIWFGTDTSNLLTIDLLLGAAVPTTSVALTVSAGNLKAIGFDCGIAVFCTTAAGIDDARISPTSFGFYFESFGGKAYSIDNLNAGGDTRFLAFQNGTTTDWAFAFEDGSDGDFNDMLVKVESIRVPEPGTLALLGLGMFAAGAVVRRRKLNS